MSTDRDSMRGSLADFLREPEPTNADLMAEIRSLSMKVDLLRAEMHRATTQTERQKP